MLKPGDSFGDYRVLKLLGKGGMGSVFLLENDEGVEVAAKILDPESAGDAESRKRFLREAQLALGVKHPNLVETYDVGEDPETGFSYILMEYVSGGSLAERIKSGPLAVNDAIRIVYQIASVLELARQKGIVHRDIKPGNIMFGADGKAKLADLGIARGGLAGTETTTVTQTGMIIGTPAYMAPEQMLDAHHVDSRADIYSLGIVFYEMLVGRRPNADDTVVQLMAKAVAGEPIPDVRTMRPEVSAAVAELISLMCAMKAGERVQTPAEVTTAISQIVHGREVTIIRKRPSVVSGKSAPRDGSSRRVVAAVFGLVAVAGIAVFMHFGSRGRSSTISPSARPVDARTPPRIVTKTNEVEKIVEKVVERIVEKKDESKTTDLGSAASHPESGKSQDWRPGPNGKWFVSWDEALTDARDRKRPILVLNTGSTWCHWCKKLRTEVLDHDAFKAFADEHLTLLYLDSPCENVDQRNHNRQIVKALKFSGGVPNVRVFTGTGMFLGSVGGGGLAADAYVGKLRDILSKGGEDKLDADGRMLFTDGYAALAAKIAEERAKLPKVAKSDFKAKLVGVAVVDGDNRSRWNLNAEFLPPETHIEVPFGKTALFKVEYDFPKGYEARVWARDEWTGEQRGNSSFFGSNPSGLYKGKGVTTGFLSLLARGKGCNLKSLAIRTSSEPEIDDETREWKIGSFPVDVVFKEKVAGTSEDSSLRENSTPPGWLDDLDAAKERARVEKKLILAAFEGSDWCGWCKKMEKDVYVRPEFMPTVSPRFIPVYIDSPRDRTLLREAVRERNPALHGEYGIRGVPCVVILDAEGKELGRVGGYKKSVGALMERIDAIPGAAEPPPLLSEKGHVVDVRSVSDASATKAVQKTLNALFPGWKTTENAERQENHREGYVREHLGRTDCVCTHPRSMDQPEVLLRRSLVVPKANPVMRFSVAAHHPLSEFCVQAKVNGALVFEEDVAGGKWRDVCVDLSRWAGRQVKVELVHRAMGWNWEWAYWWRMEIGEWDGREPRLSKLVRAEKLLDRSRYADSDPTKAARKAFKALFPGWDVSENGATDGIGYYEEYRHRCNLVMTHPPRKDIPVVLSKAVKVPKGGAALHLEVASHEDGDFELEVHVRGKLVACETITPDRGFANVDVDLSEFAGRNVKVEIRQAPNNWQNEMAYWSKIEVK